MSASAFASAATLDRKIANYTNTWNNFCLKNESDEIIVEFDSNAWTCFSVANSELNILRNNEDFNFCGYSVEGCNVLSGEELSSTIKRHLNNIPWENRYSTVHDATNASAIKINIKNDISETFVYVFVYEINIGQECDYKMCCCAICDPMSIDLYVICNILGETICFKSEDEKIIDEYKDFKIYDFEYSVNRK